MYHVYSDTDPNQDTHIVGCSLISENCKKQNITENNINLENETPDFVLLKE